MKEITKIEVQKEQIIRKGGFINKIFDIPLFKTKITLVFTDSDGEKYYLKSGN